MKLDEKKENTAEPINGSSVLNAVSANTALNANRLPRALHEELALILKRIGTKEHNKQALEQLYDLRVSKIKKHYSTTTVRFILIKWEGTRNKILPAAPCKLAHQLNQPVSSCKKHSILQERHPEVDIWMFMQGSSFYFRNFVERGLREVADQRKLASMPIYKHDYKSDNIGKFIIIPLNAILAYFNVCT